MNTQEAVLCSYFAQRGETLGDCQVKVGELRHFKDWAILSDKLICVTGREVSMQRGGIMWKRHWQHEDGAWEKVRGMAPER